MQIKPTDHKVSTGAKRAAITLKKLSWLDRVWLLRKLGSEKRALIQTASRELEEIVGPFENILLNAALRHQSNTGSDNVNLAQEPEEPSTQSVKRLLAHLSDAYVAAFLLGESAQTKKSVLASLSQARRDGIAEASKSNMTPFALEALRDVILREANRT